MWLQFRVTFQGRGRQVSGDIPNLPGSKIGKCSIFINSTACLYYVVKLLQRALYISIETDLKTRTDLYSVQGDPLQTALRKPQ